MHGNVCVCVCVSQVEELLLEAQALEAAAQEQARVTETRASALDRQEIELQQRQGMCVTLAACRHMH